MIPVRIDPFTVPLAQKTELLLATMELLQAQAGAQACVTDAAALIGEADAEAYDKVKDVMDVWADSGFSHECVRALRPKKAELDTFEAWIAMQRGYWVDAMRTLRSLRIRGMSPSSLAFARRSAGFGGR